MANPIENLLVSFGKKELSKHPELLANLVAHQLEGHGIPEPVIVDIKGLIVEALPLMLAAPAKTA